MPRKYTDEQIEWLRQYYPNSTLKDTHNAFNSHFKTDVNIRAIKYLLQQNNIVNGRKTAFKKGHISWNKGMSIKTERPDIYEKYFGRNSEYEHMGFIKKGSPVGTVSKFHNQYFVKVEMPNKWIPRSQWNWEQVNPPLQQGEKLLHLDGNKQNDDIENLVVVTDAIICRLNRLNMITEDAEITRVCVTRAKLLQKIKELENESNK